MKKLRRWRFSFQNWKRWVFGQMRIKLGWNQLAALLVHLFVYYFDWEDSPSPSSLSALFHSFTPAVVLSIHHCPIEWRNEGKATASKIRKEKGERIRMRQWRWIWAMKEKWRMCGKRQAGRCLKDEEWRGDKRWRMKDNKITKLWQ